MSEPRDERAEERDRPASFVDGSLDEYCERLTVALESLRKAPAAVDVTRTDDSLDEYFDRLSAALANLSEPLRETDMPPSPPPPALGSESVSSMELPAAVSAPSLASRAVSPAEPPDEVGQPARKTPRGRGRSASNRTVTTSKRSQAARRSDVFRPKASARPSKRRTPRAGSDRTRKRSRNR